MYGLYLGLRASAALTFRVLPSGILDIISYPFVPPTTLSGWLRRVWMLAEGHDLPNTSAKKDAPFYVLPRNIISLGAYPDVPSHIHKTKRKGVKNFSDTSFTRLIFDKKTGPTFQLHTWEYLTTDKLNAYLIAETDETLIHLRGALTNEQESTPWGCKLGKEGFAFLDDVGEVEKLEQTQQKQQPKTLLPLDVVITQDNPIDFAVHNVHRFAWRDGDTELIEPSPVKGYDIQPLALANLYNGTELEANWWQGEHLSFPVGLESILAGAA